ncbi:MAG: hypothetical protein A2849_00510 [Candidatus Taylorbacteria bacterium RIFCSPHIGHO2_01_FULL_51_15]|uniref:Amino acid transporter n=1 Tax=Candidatus Taylorbacteria bacterium RIFCSPHIGHO2_01_FULL_51_15 TaxID=1802304 RepID=A0A1G2ME27_9BACT|nr:MAG: hypothetical protein A2849_00510 [Candidatus Taylorbacteria bacterium RIFCSPHIGHO2_01_FULL_51_15]
MTIPYLSEFLMLAALHIAVVISPGPNLTLVAKNSVTMQFRLTLYCVFGIAVGSFLHVSFAILGLSGFVVRVPTLYLALQFLGASYLIYVGFKALKTKPYDVDAEVAHSARVSTACTAFREGFINMMGNPKAYLFVFALFTQVVGATPIIIKVLYGVWMSLVDIVWFAFVAFLLSSPLVKTRFTSKLHYLARVFGIVLIGFGLRILVSPFL